jgi:hypothetical protein
MPGEERDVEDHDRDEGKHDQHAAKLEGFDRASGQSVQHLDLDLHDPVASSFLTLNLVSSKPAGEVRHRGTCHALPWNV